MNMTRIGKVRAFPADFQSLRYLNQYVRHQAAEAGVSEKIILKIDMVIEELFVNIINHSHGAGGREVELRCYMDADKGADGQFFCFSLRDWGEPFDPLKREDPELNLDIGQRQVGGLGGSLVTRMADYCSYERDGESNIFKACFAADERLS